MRNVILTISAAFLVFLSCTSCDKRSEQGRTAPVVTEITATQGAPISRLADQAAIEITPKTASRDSTVSLVTIGFDVSEARVEWLLNGAPMESVNPLQFTLSVAQKGDSLQAMAYVKGVELVSNKVDIVNALPEITNVRFVTDTSKPGDTLGAEASGSDADGDKVSFLYEWTINNNPAGNKDKLEVPLKRGDKVHLKVTPFDGEVQGRAMSLDREIQNNPPVIQGHREYAFDGTTYTYQVKASDPDGDGLAYALEGAPKDMSIDKASGLITWPVPLEFRGETGVVVVVSDGNDGIAKYELKITIK